MIKKFECSVSNWFMKLLPTLGEVSPTLPCLKLVDELESRDASKWEQMIYSSVLVSALVTWNLYTGIKSIKIF